jgi:hypothetical protein
MSFTTARKNRLGRLSANSERRNCGRGSLSKGSRKFGQRKNQCSARRPSARPAIPHPLPATIAELPKEIGTTASLGLLMPKIPMQNQQKNSVKIS